MTMSVAGTAETGGTGKGPSGNRLTDRLSMRTRRLIWVWSFLALPILFYSVIRFYPTLEAFWLSHRLGPDEPTEVHRLRQLPEALR